MLECEQPKMTKIFVNYERKKKKKKWAVRKDKSTCQTLVHRIEERMKKRMRICYLLVQEVEKVNI